MRWDVAGIGNALMDALVVLESDSIIEELELTRGTMHLVEHDRWENVFDRVRAFKPEFHSGGSCANSIATVGLLGGQALYAGQVGDDEMGRHYAALIEEACGTHALQFAAAKPTGKCLSLITGADHERTMLTDLGAAVSMPGLGAMEQALGDTKVAHFTGYTLLDGPMQPIVRQAMALAEAGGGKVSLDAADPFVVHTIPDRFRDVLREHVDIAFLNEEEGTVIAGVDDAEEACRRLAGELGLSTVVVKLGSRGSVVLEDGALVRIPVFEVEARDTTGAGDSYAGAYLYGYTRGLGPEVSGRLASAVAGLTVSQVGAVVQDRTRLASVVRELTGA